MIFWDSSALVPLLLEEPDSERRRTLLRADPGVAVWWGTPVECESAIQRRTREGSLSPAEARLARERLEELARSWQEVAPLDAVRTLARRLLRTHPMRAADALQLAAALALQQAGLPQLSFASADDRLNAAAEAEGLPLV